MIQNLEVNRKPTHFVSNKSVESFMSNSSFKVFFKNAPIFQGHIEGIFMENLKSEISQKGLDRIVSNKVC